MTACNAGVVTLACKYSGGQLNDARLDMATPITNSSVSDRAVISDSIALLEASHGEDTQSGGPIELEY